MAEITWDDRDRKSNSVIASWCDAVTRKKKRMLNLFGYIEKLDV